MKTARRSRQVLRVALSLGLVAGVAVAGTASAAMPRFAPQAAFVGPRDDMRAAYEEARGQFNNLELDTAQQTLEAAIAQAQQAGLANDPALAPLLTMRAGIIYSNTGDRAQTVSAFEQAVRADYNATLPIELRSEEVQSMLDEARRRVGAPPTSEAIIHNPPDGVAGQDVVIDAQMGVPMMEGFQAALYWRSEGASEFKAVQMDTFGNLATATIPASEHRDKTIEYAIYAFDANQRAVGNKGDTQSPMQILFAGGSIAAEGDGDEPEKPKRPKGDKKLGGFFNIGFGAGLGVAHGEAERTYLQYSPVRPAFQYTEREQACAIARWWAKDGELPDPSGFQNALNQISSDPVLGAMPSVLPSNPGTLLANYDPTYCARRHPVSTGMALSPFFLQPEAGLRINNFAVSLFARLQVVTGSKVFRGDDPNIQHELADQYLNVIRSPSPAGDRDRPPFTWAIGLKAKYFLRPPEKKLRLYVGGQFGGGFARMMVNMGFANDRNGNSIPDDEEVAFENVIDPSVPGGQRCVNVWPYEGCNPMTTTAEQNLAAQVRLSADDARIDTVVAGPVFLGALFGLNVQLHKHFALFFELQATGYFWQVSTVMIDLNLGPSITF